MPLPIPSNGRKPSEASITFRYLLGREDAAVYDIIVSSGAVIRDLTVNYKSLGGEAYTLIHVLLNDFYPDTVMINIRRGLSLYGYRQELPPYGCDDRCLAITRRWR